MLATDEMLATALNRYVALSEAYLENRENLVWDGNPPLVLIEDEFEDEDYED